MDEINVVKKGNGKNYKEAKKEYNKKIGEFVKKIAKNKATDNE